MQFNTFLESVVKIKHLNLFGEESHAKMSPPYRLELAVKMKEKVKTAKTAAVLALFYPSETNETYLVLILRKTYKGVHSAQVGFPGGKYEDEDKKEHKIKLSGMASRVFQHEFDHLEGIDFTQRQ